MVFLNHKGHKGRKQHEEFVIQSCLSLFIGMGCRLQVNAIALIQPLELKRGLQPQKDFEFFMSFVFFVVLRIIKRIPHERPIPFFLFQKPDGYSKSDDSCSRARCHFINTLLTSNKSVVFSVLTLDKPAFLIIDYSRW
jgi:hypothetical protein